MRQTHLKKMFDDVTNIYSEYAEDVNSSESLCSSKQGDGSSSMGRPNAFPQNATDVASPKSELNHYLTDSKVHPHEEFDVLEWWHYNSLTYPTLARIVRDFLSIPISTCYTSFCSSLWDDIDGIYITGLDV